MDKNEIIKWENMDSEVTYELYRKKSQYEYISDLLNLSGILSEDLDFLPDKIKKHYMKIIKKLYNILKILRSVEDISEYSERKKIYILCKKKYNKYLNSDHNRYRSITHDLDFFGKF